MAAARSSPPAVWETSGPGQRPEVRHGQATSAEGAAWQHVSDDEQLVIASVRWIVDGIDEPDQVPETKSRSLGLPA